MNMTPRERYERDKQRQIDRLSFDAERHMREAEDLYARIMALEEETFDQAMREGMFDELKARRQDTGL